MGYPKTSTLVSSAIIRCSYFNSFLGVFGYPDETLSRVFDILLDNIRHFHVSGGNFSLSNNKLNAAVSIN